MIVYISSSYTFGDTAENVRRACLAGDEILRKGHTPFVPHLAHLWHLISPKSYEEWLKIDFALLSMCDALLRLDGKSKGADLEVVEAKKLCMLIFYDIKDIPIRK